MRYNRLFLDIDGTLIGTIDSLIGHDPRLKKSLHDYMDQGGEIGLVTGRSEEYASAVYEIFGLNGIRIVEMGAGIIYEDGERSILTPLKNIDKIRKFLKTYGLLDSMREEKKSFMISLVLPEFPRHDPSRLRLVYNKVRDKFKVSFPNATIECDNYSIDIYNPKSNKGRALELCAQKKKIAMGKVALAGDSRSDYDCFKFVNSRGGLVAYVGLDGIFEEDLRKEFHNLYITKNKRSSGVVELVEFILNS